MKRFYLISLGFLFLLSCTTEEPTIVNCSPVSVKIFNNSESVFTFTNGKLNSIDAYKGTDQNAKSTYSYNGDLIDKISTTGIDGITYDYMAIYTGTNLLKLTYAEPGSSNSLIELRYIYNGDKVSSFESWYGNGSGTLFQIGHTNFGYDSNDNLIQSQVYLDLVAFISIAFGIEPGAYFPEQLFVYEYVTSDSPNPLYGTYAFSNQDYSLLKNLPASIKITDVDGNVTSESFEFETDENGNTVNATGSDGSYVQGTYQCDQ